MKILINNEKIDNRIFLEEIKVLYFIIVIVNLFSNTDKFNENAEVRFPIITKFITNNLKIPLNIKNLEDVTTIIKDKIKIYDNIFYNKTIDITLYKNIDEFLSVCNEIDDKDDRNECIIMFREDYIDKYNLNNKIFYFIEVTKIDWKHNNFKYKSIQFGFHCIIDAETGSVIYYEKQR